MPRAILSVVLLCVGLWLSLGPGHAQFSGQMFVTGTTAAGVSPPAIDCAGVACKGVNGIATSGGKFSITSVSTTNGNVGVCVAGLVNSTDNFTAISGGGITFTSVKDILNGNDGMSFWCGKSSTALSAVTLQVTVGTTNVDSAFVTAAAFGISGVTFSSMFDPNAALPASCGNTCSSSNPSIATTNADDLVCEGARFGSTGSPSATATWTAVWNPSSGFFLLQCKSFTSAQPAFTPSIPADVNGAIATAFTAN